MKGFFVSKIHASSMLTVQRSLGDFLLLTGVGLGQQEVHGDGHNTAKADPREAERADTKCHAADTKDQGDTEIGRAHV